MKITQAEARKILALESALYTETMYLLANNPEDPNRLLDMATHYFSLYLMTETELRLAEQGGYSEIEIDSGVVDFLKEYTDDKEIVEDVYGLYPELVEDLKGIVKRLEGEGLN